MNLIAEPSEDPLPLSAAAVHLGEPADSGAASLPIAHNPAATPPSQPAAETPGWVFFAANAGWGASTAHMLVLLPFLLRRQGLSVEAIAAITAPTFLPLSLQFLWTPLLDLGPRRRTFFIWASLLASVLTLWSFQLLKAGHYGAMLAALIAVNGLFTVASAALSMLVATTVPPARQGQAFGLQCTSGMVMQGVLGTVLLAFTEPPEALVRICQKLGLPSGPMPLMQQGELLALLLVGSGLCGLLMPEARPVRVARHGNRGLPSWTQLTVYLRRTVRNAADETARVFKTRLGIIGLLTCVAPISTGAAANLFGAIGKDFGAGAGTVSMTTGFGAALAMAAGSMFGGWASDRADRRNAYMASGMALAVVAACMAFLPATPLTFAICGLAYAAFTGVAYATYYPFVVQLIGTGPGISTRYSICTSASNLAIYYVTLLDGVGYSRSGPVGLLRWDAALNIGGVCLILWLSSSLRRSRRSRELLVDPASVVR